MSQLNLNCYVYNTQGVRSIIALNEEKTPVLCLKPSTKHDLSGRVSKNKIRDWF